MEGAEEKLESKKEKATEAKDQEVIKPQDVELRNEDSDKKESPAKVVAKAEAKKKKKVDKAENEKKEATKQVIDSIEQAKKTNA